MKKAEVEVKIRNIIDKITKEFNINIKAENIDFHDNLFNYGFNSVTLVAMAVNIETEFGFEFEDDYLGLDMFQNLNDLTDYVLKRCIEKPEINEH